MMLRKLLTLEGEVRKLLKRSIKPSEVNRQAARIPQLINRLFRLWQKNPTMRLGQLIGNVIPEMDLYYVEDDELIERLEKYYAGLERKRKKKERGH